MQCIIFDMSEHVYNPSPKDVLLSHARFLNDEGIFFVSIDGLVNCTMSCKIDEFMFYFWLCSCAKTYFQPITVLQCLQLTSCTAFSEDRERHPIATL